MDHTAPGRGAITGKESNAVWDLLRLKHPVTKKTFTSYPHLTFALESDRVIATVTIPNDIKSSFRRRLVALGVEGFSRVLLDVEQWLLAAIKGDDGAAPWIVVVQRRYPTQKSQAIVDASLEFDLRTAFPRQKKRGKRVKAQPQWLNATYEALAKKHSNLQIAVGAIFPYRSSSSTKTRDILDRIEKTWLACKPLLDVMKLRSPN
jgi:hypothetical protein